MSGHPETGAKRPALTRLLPTGRFPASLGGAMWGSNAFAKAGRSCREAISRAARRVLYATLLCFAISGTFASAWAAVPEGVWLMPSKAALQIYDCGGLLCGRIVWLQLARNRFGDLIRDIENPDPALKRRALCGQTILWGLRPAGSDRWEGGALYNPDDGRTYRVNAELRSPDKFVARIYLGLPMLGQNRTLLRMSRLGSDPSCGADSSEATNLSTR